MPKSHPEMHTILSMLLVIALASLLMTGPVVATATDSAAELVGLWEAKGQFGPEVQGALTLTRTGAQWSAEIGGYESTFRDNNGLIEFQIEGDRGGFRGRLDSDGKRLEGHWIQPGTISTGLQVASPVVFEAVGKDRWRGQVIPLPDDFTFYLVARQRPDGTVGAFLRNPERNQGIFINVDRIERDDNQIKLIGVFFRRTEEKVLLEGTYYPDENRISIDIASRGGSYDFRRVDDDVASPFYARGKNPGPYVYHPPVQEDDGWSVGTLDEVGIALEPIRRLIETEIDPAATDIQDVYIHAMLIARHGKLVLEEYFHGYHRDKPHDTRSASKSLTATLVGAAIEAGEPIATSSPVYKTIYGEDLPDKIDPRKTRMTVEHLLTMSSGYDCDDRDTSTPGAEDRMQDQDENTDWYDYTLALPMVREPGETAVYCSINPNLIGNVLIQATGQSLPLLFQRLIAEPLQIERYYLNLQPTGEPYGGGGIRWLPRDFIKLGQLHLDGGTWNGKRILSEQWAERATSPLYELRERGYGYLWWIVELPYKDRTVRAFFAGGNGGQVVIGVPELDLVVTFFGGNYNSKTLFRAQQEFVPDFILPAVDDGIESESQFSR